MRWVTHGTSHESTSAPALRMISGPRTGRSCHAHVSDRTAVAKGEAEAAAAHSDDRWLQRGPKEARQMGAEVWNKARRLHLGNDFSDRHRTRRSAIYPGPPSRSCGPATGRVSGGSIRLGERPIEAHPRGLLGFS